MERSDSLEMMASGPVISTRGLTKRFGDIVAVDALDLDVQRGEVFGYLGPNGAGKTTTIRMLLDFLRPDEGTLRVLSGTGAETAIRARIGYLPGELSFDPTYTAADVVAFFGDLRGGVDHGRVEELYERFDLDPHRPFKTLSSGNRRKVGLVQAFMHRPELLLLDEPTSGLDPLLQQEFNTLVREASGDGATVLLSSHVLPEVEALADRVGILRKGRLVTTTSVKELQRKARQRIDLHVKGRATVSAFSGLAGVVECSRTGRVIHLTVEGSVDGVIKQAAKIDVQRIVTHETDLEDVFLDFYRTEES